MYGVYVGSLLLLASEGATLRSVQSRIAMIYIFFFVCQFCPLTISMSGLNISPRYKRRAP